MARSAPNFYARAVSTSNADFELYEFFKEQPIDQEILTNNKTASRKAALLLIFFELLVEVTGLEPATYCLQSSRSPS